MRSVYPSLVLLPVPMLFYGILHHHVLGPLRTLALSRRAARFVLKRMPPCRCRIVPDDVAPVLDLIGRVMPHRLAACFETACALELWLAFHGQRVRVCIGKRMENGKILLHAWVEPDGFLKDGRFSEIDVRY